MQPLMQLLQLPLQPPLCQPPCLEIQTMAKAKKTIKPKRTKILVKDMPFSSISSHMGDFKNSIPRRTEKRNNEMYPASGTAKKYTMLDGVFVANKAQPKGGNRTL